jgi:hypothetical protein
MNSSSYLAAVLVMLTGFAEQGELVHSVAAASSLRLSSRQENPAKHVAQVGLQASDLPARFQPAPALIQKLIADGIRSRQADLNRAGMVVDQVSTFVNFKDAAMAAAIRFHFVDQQAVNRFDTSLLRPDAQTIFVSGLEHSLTNFGAVQVKSVQEISPLTGIGSLAKGFAIEAALVSLPWSLSTQAIALRRERQGGLVFLASLNHATPGITVQELALRFDQRLLQTQPARTIRGNLENRARPSPALPLQ